MKKPPKYKFVPTDAGRSSSVCGRGEYNDCTVRALATACGMHYTNAYRIIENEGRMPGKGFNFARLMAERFKVYQDIHNCREANGGVPRPFLFWDKRRLGYRPGTFAKFLNEVVTPTGIYIVRTERHVFAVVHGVVHDTAPTDARKRVHHYWQIMRSS